MGLARLCRHLFMPAWLLRRKFTSALLAEIEQAIITFEGKHAGEIRFAVEHALEITDLWSRLPARERSLEVFGALRVWDTDANNGILIYVLYAEHAVEIVADRGIARRVPQADWDALCRDVESQFRAGRFREGSLKAIEGASLLLARHFPNSPRNADELPNQPILL